MIISHNFNSENANASKKFHVWKWNVTCVVWPKKLLFTAFTSYGNNRCYVASILIYFKNVETIPLYVASSKKNFLSTSRLFFYRDRGYKLTNVPAPACKISERRESYSRFIFFSSHSWSTVAEFILAYWPPSRFQSILLLPLRLLKSVTWRKCAVNVLESFWDCNIPIMTSEGINRDSECDKCSLVLKRKQGTDNIVTIVL